MTRAGITRFAIGHVLTSAGCFLLICALASCKKESGVHCPYVELEQRSSSLDLSPVADIPQIMDTLKKYKELRPIWMFVNYNLNGFNATVRCNVYSEGLIIFNQPYTLWYP